jgi:hypothetical protein
MRHLIFDIPRAAPATKPLALSANNSGSTKPWFVAICN